ncbi:hypothetical protein, partial [Veronia pacifica]|uniref:hypothetical protein n=1 Tax=Veronia pacifica TaxID=1080227 RepID=UPI001112CC40
MTARLVIDTVDDVLKENNEGFSVAVTNVVDGSNNSVFENLNLDSATVNTIIVDDGLSTVGVTLSADKNEVTEGE